MDSRPESPAGSAIRRARRRPRGVRHHFRRGLQQPPRIGVAGASNTASRRPDLDDAAEIHDRDPMGEVAHQAKIMGDEEDGQAEPLLQLEQQVDDLRLHGDIEGRDELVGDQAFRLDGERAGDADALALAAGEFMRERPPASAGRRTSRAARRPVPISAPAARSWTASASPRISRTRHARVERAVADPGTPSGRGGGSGDRGAARRGRRRRQSDLPGVGLVQAHQTAREGRFAAAGFADDAEGFAARDPQ